jgi:hypothetical protein
MFESTWREKMSLAIQNISLGIQVAKFLHNISIFFYPPVLLSDGKIKFSSALLHSIWEISEVYVTVSLHKTVPQAPALQASQEY